MNLMKLPRARMNWRKKSSGLQRGSVDDKEANGTIHLIEWSTTPMVPDFTDPAMCYYPSGYPSTAYYYGGYDGSMNDWDHGSRYVNPDGVDMCQGVYGDNGSLMYHGYGYGPYSPYSPASSPVPTMGHDGQLYGPQPVRQKIDVASNLSTNELQKLIEDTLAALFE